MTQASAMPKLVAPDENAVLFIGAGANYYRIQGVEFTSAPGIYSQGLIEIGTGGETSNSQLAHDLDFDRDYIHGNSQAGGKRGIALNGGATTIENCYFSALISTGQDTQAIAGWNGPGPYKILNNYLEAGTEIVAFGGAPVSIPLNVPSDILIKNNTFFKPLSWRPGDPSYAGVRVWAKNHIELKNAQRVTIDSNTFTNNWVGADQGGYVLVFGVRVEGGLVPWAVVKDIVVTNNVIRHAASGALFMGQDSIAGSGGSAGNFLIKNNLWEDLRNDWGGDGRLFLVENRVLGINFDHNTAFETGWLLVLDGLFNFNINFTNNIVNVAAGVIGPNTGVGAPSFYAHSIGGVFLNNVLIGNSYYPYPPTTTIVSSMDQVGFANYGAENFLLASNSSFKGMATDGTDIGSHVQPSAMMIPTGWTNLISKNTGKCLDVAGISPNPGASLQQWTCWGGSNQAFQLTPVNGGYTITPKNSGLAVEIAGGPSVTWPGATVGQWYYWGGSSQIWQVVPTEDGYFSFRPNNDGLCMDISGSSKTDGAPVVQSTCASVDSQKWSFNPVQ